MYKCKFCSQEFDNPKKIGAHTKHCKSNPNRQLGFTKLTEEQEKKRAEGVLKSNKDKEIITKRSETIKGRFKSGELKITISESSEEIRKKKLSKIAKERKLGGYKQGSGRGKKGWYKGVWCDSSYELAWVIYNLEHNISFERNTEKFDYEYEGELLKWIPDFILEDGSFVEIKGYYDKKAKAKISSFKLPIKLLMQKDLKHVFDYVYKKYGKNFIKLYKYNTGV